MSVTYKYSLISNIILILFTIVFAITVYSSIDQENTNLNQIQAKYEEPFTENDQCTSSTLINVSFAIVLAALWNGKRIIKIGTI
jgi:archaellum component FlaF (FlaF/FlaG flagellin family)